MYLSSSQLGKECPGYNSNLTPTPSAFLYFIITDNTSDPCHKQHKEMNMQHLNDKMNIKEH